MSLYTNEIHQFMRSRDWPKGLIYQVREPMNPEPHLNIIFFRDNWLGLSPEAQMQATVVVREIMAKLWGEGVPIYVEKMEHEIEPVDDEG